MRKFITFVLLVCSLNMVAQQKWGVKDPASYFYADLSFDVNKAFGLYDNDRTVVDHRGLDWDLEIGVRDSHVGLFLFYGRFEEMNYVNLGAGLDYYVHWLRDTKFKLYNPLNNEWVDFVDGIEFSIGNAITIADRIREDDWRGGEGFTYLNPKARTIVWFGDLGFTLTAKIQSRPELGKKIFEGQAGFIYKRNRN